MVAWETATRRALIIETLRAREVDERLELNDSAIRRYYDEHPSQFKQPDEIEVVEILTDTEDQAAKLLERARNGEDMEKLAVQYSIREGAAASKGRFHMHPFEAARFGALLRAANEAPPGALQGPVELRDVTPRRPGLLDFQGRRAHRGQTKTLREGEKTGALLARQGRGEAVGGEADPPTEGEARLEYRRLSGAAREDE